MSKEILCKHKYIRYIQVDRKKVVQPLILASSIILSIALPLKKIQNYAL
jgi:hypothetical protein